MPKGPNKHLDLQDRHVIEDGIASGLSASEIARRLHVQASTVTREVLSNRVVKPPEQKNMSPSKRCAGYYECDKHGALCETCLTPGQRSCRRCQLHRCFDICPDFELRMCEGTARWPYVCTCHDLARTRCGLPKCRYIATRADAVANARKTSARTGPAVGEEELAAMVELVRPLLRRGLSPEAIWLEHSDELPVGVRTFYRYVELGYVDVPSLEMPRKVRYRRRAPAAARGADRVDRTGRTFEDFMALDDHRRSKAVQVDSVIGGVHDVQRILSLYLPPIRFQLYMLLGGPGSAEVVSALDRIEAAMGSRGAFEAAFGTVLADRGAEFDDAEGMERSALEPGARRCRVYFCDPMRPAQKGGCERTHEELRRILPKRRSDFDALAEADVSLACSHVNSYPRRGLALRVLPQSLFDDLGIAEVPVDEIRLRPELIPHARK